ncbi:CDP-alcohol phosphatidyltransferase family protein [Pelagovum pacificum]|uniref:CDP-alcohol phosphatidyltransferase family protein n=1 Tax=Pelagovum pacificum TaxID=2588711 RepID=A0A5C5GGP9_9RHOB|nr:CDP-alcohol phosphatidyltransferase family protein [Pelagovum pacificum]QQA43117.1 CDP-alcohol phosphatidyltransferase family protein [Pelagovum pacificum]TNY33740.1 CDP-alcohol phosphatidyltransferase family protein [Pelagovum pacificum]
MPDVTASPTPRSRCRVDKSFLTRQTLPARPHDTPRKFHEDDNTMTPMDTHRRKGDEVVALQGAAVSGAIGAWLGLLVPMVLVAVLLPGLGIVFTGLLAILWLAIGALAIVGLSEYHPYARFGAANVTTAARAAGTLLLGAVSIAFDRLPDEAPQAVAAAGLAIISLDGVDGFIARRTGLASRYGARFDMEVDAGLTLVLSFAAWQAGAAPLAILALVLPHYLFSMAKPFAPWLDRPLRPSLVRKAICVLQMALPVVLLALPVLRDQGVLLTCGILAAVVGSFLRDIVYLASRRSEAE